MKRQFLPLLTSVFVLIFFSTASAQVRFGIKAGLNLANLSFVNFGELEPSLKMLPTYQVGALAEFGITENLGVGVGLQLHGKGAKSDEANDDSSIKLGYLQVPVMLQFRKSGFYAGVGPYAAFGIFGKSETGGEREDVSFGSGVDDDFSPLDFGAGLELGYEFANFRATASYNLGLANMLPKDQRPDGFDFAIKSNVIGIALAYLFGGE